MRQFTVEQTSNIAFALETSAATFRHLIREGIDSGDAISAGFYARNLVRIERAAHIAWNLENQFPTEN